MANISIKDVPEQWAEALRQRAARNHRSLQGELMALIEQAVQADVSAAPPGDNAVGKGARVVGWGPCWVTRLSGRAGRPSSRLLPNSTPSTRAPSTKSPWGSTSSAPTGIHVEPAPVRGGAAIALPGSATPLVVDCSTLAGLVFQEDLAGPGRRANCRQDPACAGLVAVRDGQRRGQEAESRSGGHCCRWPARCSVSSGSSCIRWSRPAFLRWPPSTNCRPTTPPTSGWLPN